MNQVKVNPGDILYFKEARQGLQNKDKPMSFEGNAFGLFLGLIPSWSKKEPKTADIFKALGGMGVLTFDDVYTFLGKEQGDLCVSKWKEKYTGESKPKSDLSTFLASEGDHEPRLEIVP